MLQELLRAPVTEVLRRDPVRAYSGTALIDVVELMHENDCGVVIAEEDDGRMCGVFTEHDIKHRLPVTDLLWHHLPLSAAMTRSPTSAPRGTSIARALRIMHYGRHRHLPLANDTGRVTGLVSVRDILAYIADLFPQEFHNLPSDPAHETSRRWGG